MARGRSQLAVFERDIWSRAKPGGTSKVKPAFRMPKAVHSWARDGPVEEARTIAVQATPVAISRIGYFNIVFRTLTAD